MISLTPLTVVAGVLVLSLAGNGVMTRAYLTQRDNARSAMDQAERNLGVAKMCSDNTRELEQAGARQAAAAAATIAEAQAKALTAQRRAQVLASRPATRPGDDCGSAQDRIDQWMRER